MFKLNKLLVHIYEARRVAELSKQPYKKQQMVQNFLNNSGITPDILALDHLVRFIQPANFWMRSNRKPIVFTAV